MSQRQDDTAGEIETPDLQNTASETPEDRKKAWKRELREALAEHYPDIHGYPDTKEINIQEVRRRFGISHLIDREGFRLGLLGERAPRDPSQRAEIIKAIRRTEAVPLGGETAETLSHFLKDAGPYFDIDRRYGFPGDIILKGKLDNARILLRCVDNPRESGLPHPMTDIDGLKEHIVAAAQLIGDSRRGTTQSKTSDSDSSVTGSTGSNNIPTTNPPELTAVHVLTWNESAARDFKAEADRRGVRLESVTEFLGNFLDLKKALSIVDGLIRDKLGLSAPENLDDMVWLAQQWRLNGVHGKRIDSETLIYRFTESEPNLSNGRIFLVFAKTGLGKSSILLRTARALLLGRLRQNQDSPGVLTKIPVLVRGKDLAVDSSFDGLASAISKSVDLMYGLSLPITSAQELLKDGYLYVMIDSAEEIADFHSFQALEAFILKLQSMQPFGSDVLVTSRVEIFPLYEQEAISQREIDGRLNWIVPIENTYVPLSAPDATPLAHRPIKTIRDRNFRSALQCLLNRPLFFQILSEETAREQIEVLSAQKKERKGALSQNGIFYRLFEKLTKRWAEQVIDGYPADSGATTDSFLKLCVDLVGIFFELSVERKLPLKNQMEFPLIDILERLGPLCRQSTSLRSGRISDEELASFMRYSTIMCHQEDTRFETSELYDARLEISGLYDAQFEVGKLCLPSTSILVFFLAKYFVAKFRGNVDEAYSNTRLLLQRLGLTSIERLSIPFEEMDIKDLPADCEKDAKGCLLMFISGALSEDGAPDRLHALLADLSGRNRRQVTAQQALVQSLSLIDLKAPLWLSENLLYLTTHETPQLQSVAVNRYAGSPRVELAGLSCPMSDFARILPDSQIVHTTGAANLEFAKLPISMTERATTSIWARSLSEGPESIRGCASLEFLSSVFDQWSKVHLGEFRLVLGSRRDLGHYAYDEKEESSRPLDRKSQKFVKVLQPSFLIQDSPVTNGQFLRFLKSKEGKGWDPRFIRDKTRNDYYLRHWDKLPENDLGLADLLSMPLDEVAEGSKLAEWLKAPVIYVNWQAAKAFATWLHCRLPTEAEYEMAARMYQPRELGEYEARVTKCSEAPAFGPELPWFDLSSPAINKMDLQNRNSLDDFAIRLLGANQANSELFPYVSRELKAGNGFVTWAKSKTNELIELGLAPKLAEALQPAKHLVGGLRYWMEDIWHPCWPPVNTEVEDGEQIHLESPYQDGWCSTSDHELRFASRQKDWRKDFQRVLRGSSLQMSDSQMRISFRESQRETNVNPDVGFRCVRPIWPDRSIDYPEGTEQSEHRGNRLETH